MRLYWRPRGGIVAEPLLFDAVRAESPSVLLALLAGEGHRRFSWRAKYDALLECNKVRDRDRCQHLVEILLYAGNAAPLHPGAPEISSDAIKEVLERHPRFDERKPEPEMRGELARLPS